MSDQDVQHRQVVSVVRPSRRFCGWRSISVTRQAPLHLIEPALYRAHKINEFSPIFDHVEIRDAKVTLSHAYCKQQLRQVVRIPWLEKLTGGQDIGAQAS